MKTGLVIIQFIFICSAAAQVSKPPVDTSAFRRWPFIVTQSISNDGNYFTYCIKNGQEGLYSSFIRSIKDSTQLELPNVSEARFTRNSKFSVFQRQDSLGLLHLASGQLTWISGVASFHLYEDSGCIYLVYLRNKQCNLIVRNMENGHETTVPDVIQSSPLKKEGFFLLKTGISRDPIFKLLKLNPKGVKVVDLLPATDSLAEIPQACVAVDDENQQIAFVIHSKMEYSIWCLSSQADRAHMLVIDSIPAISGFVKVKDISELAFSHDGKRIFFTVNMGGDAQYNHTKREGVNIWNYKDTRLQSQQLYEITHPETGPSIAVFDISRKSCFLLNSADEVVEQCPASQDTIAFIYKLFGGSPEEEHWNTASRVINYLVSTVTGKRQQVDMSIGALSPGGRYLLGTDYNHQFFYIQGLQSRISRNLSNLFPLSSRLDETYDKPGLRPSGLQIAGWLNGDSGLILYDRYDIWFVNPADTAPATNLTRGFGRIHAIQLRLIGGCDPGGFCRLQGKVLVSAFDETTKESGYMILDIRNSRLQKLSMGPYKFEGPFGSLPDTEWLQHGNGRAFIVKRQSASESPNLFMTKDFVNFRPLTFLHPESAYNWLTSQVITWHIDKKITLHGIVYKPSDLDPTKKYPVIINFYEQLSDHAFEYRRPDYCIDNINIPWFVSQGYIVFTPDIHYRIGHPGRSAYESIVSGTKALSEYNWVDRKRIALQGHSWGGFEANYVVSHCDLYCAAVSASAFSDFISGYGALTYSGASEQYFFDVYQFRIGFTPWQRPDLYSENSPVLSANKVHTPILLMNNVADGVTPFAQGVEFFTALRRLKRQVWMLQYDNEGHSLSREAAVDYTVRITQFFDHFCKDALAPKWMSDGISAKLKGIDDGLRPSKTRNSQR